jgi:hypothetical protein
MSTQKSTAIALAFLLSLLAAGCGRINAPPPDATAEPPAQGTGAAEIRLTPSDAQSYLFFGHAVAISEDTLVVGATGYAHTIDEEYRQEVAGAAYVFQREGTSWIEGAKLTAGDAEIGDGFGHAVAIDGDTIVVGARLKNDAIGGNGTGAAYVFQRGGTTWSEQAKLTADDGAPFDLFGHAVAISGDTILIGARSADGPAGRRNSGAVYVFQRSGQTWTQQAKLINSDTEATDHFGHAVAINGDTVVVGAFGHDDPARGRNSGAVYVFQRHGETWMEQTKLTASDAKPYAQFGYALAMSDDTLVVGANQDSDALASDAAAQFPEGKAGAVYVFQQKRKTWSEQAKLTPGDAEEYGFFGHAVAIGHTTDGDVVVVGEMWSEMAHFFQLREGAWTEISKLPPDDSATITALGKSVAASRDTAVVGARSYSERATRGDTATQSGAVYVYDLGAASAQSPATSTPEPTATSLPAPAPSIQKTVIKPLLTVQGTPFAEILFIGWSPDPENDNEIAAFSTVDKPDPQSDRLFSTLHFLNTDTGELCQYPDAYPGMRDIRPRTAWLPDGRILVITDHDEVVLHTPCTDDFTTVSDDFPEPILENGIVAQSPDRSTLLLRSQHAYWLFEPATRAMRQVEGLAPGQMTADTTCRGDWSPSGDQVAISTLGSATYETGITVHFVNAQTGQVERTVELECTHGRSAPRLDWLISDRLVIWGGSDSGPVQVTLGPGEPQVIRIIPEIFGLDIVYPDDMAGIATVEDQAADTYHIVMTLSLPGSDLIYLYHSESDEVEELPHELPTFLLSPNGDWTSMRKWDWDNPPSVPESVDEFRLIWMDSDQEAHHLVVEGHIPRQYPDLHAVWLADRSQMAFSSSQGVSVVSIPDGALLGFWELEGYEGIGFPGLFASPTGDVIAVDAQFSEPDGQSTTGAGLYLIHVSR